MNTKYFTTRRRFLANAAAATGAVLIPPCIVPSSVFGADGSVAPSNRITIGFIGTGKMAHDGRTTGFFGYAVSARQSLRAA